MKSAVAKRVERRQLCYIVFTVVCALALSGCAGLQGSSSAPKPDTTPPTAPANLTATATLASSINLTWTASTDNVGVAGYKVERCTGAGCVNFGQIAAPTATSFDDSGLAPSTAYSYRVGATDAAGNNSAYSNIFSTTTLAAPDTTPPTAPSNLTATASSATQVNLAWTASTDNVGVTGYIVERCSGTGCANFVQIATPTTTTFNDTGLTASTSYFYRVRATDAAGNLSGYSNTSSAATPAAPDTTPPTAPTNLTATAASPTQINLAWTASTDNVGVTGYKVERCSGTGCANFVQIATPTTTTFNDTGLTASTSYFYRVRATDAAGNLSGYSNTASATTSAPTFVAPSNLSAAAVSSSQINLVWTAGTETGGTITNYLVERCAGEGCANFAQIAAPAGTSFSDTGLSVSTSYSYRVRETDAANNFSGYSNVAGATTAGANVAVTISPVRGSVSTSQTQQFTATVTGSANIAVNWSVDGTPGGNSTIGTISAAGLYKPPSTGGMHTITATSQADVMKSASATFGVTNLAGVLTYHNDLSRDGANTQEYALTTATVGTATFGKLFSCTADGAIFAQPLWVPGVTIGGVAHNVVIVATQHDSVYAFDADASPCVTLWQASLLDSKHGATAGETSVPSGTNNSLVGSGFGDILPEVGVTGTPVIDATAGTIYVVSKSAVANAPPIHQRLHALSLASGSEKTGSPLNIDNTFSVSGTGDGSVGGQVAFNPQNEHQRPGLALVNGVVYVCWASHEDADPYHGWVMGFNTSPLSLAPGAVFNSTPNQVAPVSYSRGGIWMGGGAPAADSSGNLYLLTGNGTFDADSGGSNYGDSTLKLSTAGGLSVADWFTPADQSMLDGNDTDHGSGGAAVLVTTANGSFVIGGGKEGNLFMLKQSSLGHYGANFNPLNSNAYQIFSVGNSIFSTAAFWNNSLYIGPANATLQAFPFDTGTGMFKTAAATSTGQAFGFPGATPSISALGATNGIVWALDNSLYCTPQSPGCGATVLHAYDATQLASELWNSTQAAGDRAGNAVKFTVPTIANGKVYIGTRGNDPGTGATSSIPGELEVYGLKPN